MATLGIDFGTSNSAAGIVVDGAPHVIEMEPGAKTMPTAVFLDFEDGQILYGRAAAKAMMDGQDGRFMRSLKSILGTPLAHEPRQFMNKKQTLIDVVAAFLTQIRLRAERQTGQRFDSVVSGRPVRFHSASETRNAQAQADLQQAYAQAGFKSVSFLPEPEAAALAVGGTGRFLIVDIGGGTSDFTLCDRMDGKTTTLASQGIRLGGTDFDKTLSLSNAMPLLGYGAEIGRAFGTDTDTAPRALYHDLATWEAIAFVYNPSLLRDVRGWARLAKTPKLFGRLDTVLDMHLGHDLAYAVEAGKIAANGAAQGRIEMNVIEKGLSAMIDTLQMMRDLAGFAQQICDCAQETVAMAGVDAASVDRIVFVGGSSLMNVIRTKLLSAFPAAQPEDTEVFTAVVDGLALAAGGSQTP